MYIIFANCCATYAFMDSNYLMFNFCDQLYDTIRYDSVYLTCSKKLTGSQLSLPHGINKNK